MITLLTIVHIAACIFLILVVLLQPGKAGGMGAAFGGASQAVFGARGATSFLGKITAICAIIFMLTSIGLSYLATSKEKSLREESERQEERAKAREVRPSKRAKTKAGAMSEEGEGAGAAKKAAPAHDEAEDAPAPAEDAAAPAPAKATKRPAPPAPSGP
jgi:preprotein translocase subunit SecG